MHIASPSRKIAYLHIHYLNSRSYICLNEAQSGKGEAITSWVEVLDFCFDFLDQKLACFDHLGQILLCFDFLGQTTVFFDFLDQILVCFNFLDPTKKFDFFQPSFDVSTFLIKVRNFSTFSNAWTDILKSLFVRPRIDIFRLSRTKLGIFLQTTL